MAKLLPSQLERLSYTKRDLELVDAEVNRFITSFIPVIKNTGKANAGRLFLRIFEALIDKLNYSQDMAYRQAVLRTVTERQAAIDIAELVRYVPSGCSSATVDLKFTALTGVAPVEGISIPQYQIVLTGSAPIKQFLVLESAVIPAGQSFVYPVKAVEGSRVVNQVISASTRGVPGEEIRMPVAKTPRDYLEVKVDGIPFTIKDDLKDSQPVDNHCMLRDDADRVTTLVFGDGSYGTKLSPGSSVTATYISSSGEAGNTAAGFINKVAGSLSALASVSNPDQASGGFDGDEVEDIVRKAPLFASAARGASLGDVNFYRAGKDLDFETLAQKLVPSVFAAKAAEGVGPVVNLYIMPAGGGVASSSILEDVESKLTPHLIHGARVNAKPLSSAHINISMDVSLLSSRTNKALARRKIFEAISAFNLDGSENPNGALYFRNITIGRGFAISDVDAIVEGIDNSSLVDFINYTIFTRYPSPVAANIDTLVNFIGEIEPLPGCSYDDWTVTATGTGTFILFKNGLFDSEGSIGVTHNSAENLVRFTLGTPSDSFLSHIDSWYFSTSAYKNNIQLSKYEFMELFRPSDLSISVFFPGELGYGNR